MTNRTEGNREIRVFEVYPLSPTPTFELIATLKRFNGSEVFSFSQGRLAFRHENATLVTVWNFVSDSILTWDVAGKCDFVCLLAFHDHRLSIC